ncbi:MAG: hypothetical protein H6745_13260 [Deltaproteobacteria bacterium]|nr:hypothetical protein [Deltaproteobacteria bacterium]
MSRRATRRLLLALAFAGSAIACGGYTDIPLPIREVASLTVEASALFPSATGRVQLAVDVPADVARPLTFVGPPQTVAGTGTAVASWALGACPDALATTPALRLCVAVEAGPVIAYPVTITAVVESRADNRRFTLIGEIPAP